VSLPILQTLYQSAQHLYEIPNTGCKLLIRNVIDTNFFFSGGGSPFTGLHRAQCTLPDVTPSWRQRGGRRQVSYSYIVAITRHLFPYGIAIQANVFKKGYQCKELIYTVSRYYSVLEQDLHPVQRSNPKRYRVPGLNCGSSPVLSESLNLRLTAESGTSALYGTLLIFIIFIGCDGELQELMTDLGINTAGRVDEKRDRNY
jgi:hypothetical protein